MRKRAIKHEATRRGEVNLGRKGKRVGFLVLRKALRALKLTQIHGGMALHLLNEVD